MTQEEKSLLLKDLCARLPYGVKISLDKKHIEESSFIGIYCDDIVLLSLNGESMNLLTHIEKYGVKPYLRSMSSMTEEERNEWISLMRKEYREQYPYSAIDTSYYEYFPTIESFDYLNSNHFDYRGLIEKSLALMAPEEMYK